MKGPLSEQQQQQLTAKPTGNAAAVHGCSRLRLSPVHLKNAHLGSSIPVVGTDTTSQPFSGRNASATASQEINR